MTAFWWFMRHLFKARQDATTVAAQEDLLPSVFDAIGASFPFASSGDSIFDEKRRQEKFVYGEDGLIYTFTEKGFEKLSSGRSKKSPH